MGGWRHGCTVCRGEAQGRWPWSRWLEGRGISPSSHETGNPCPAAISQKEAAVCVREEELELWVVVPPGQGHSLSEEGSDNPVSTPRLSQTAQVQATVSRRAPVPPALK